MSGRERGIVPAGGGTSIKTILQGTAMKTIPAVCVFVYVGVCRVPFVVCRVNEENGEKEECI